MKRNVFSLHSTLPPAELTVRLDQEVQVRNAQERGRRRLFLRWKGENKFTLFMVEYENYEGPVEAGRGSVSMRARSGMGRSGSYSVILCGEIAADGEGSVIAVHFKQLLIRWLLLVIAAGCFAGFAATGQLLACLLTAVLGVPFLYNMLTPQRSRSGGELRDELEFSVAAIDGATDS